MLQKLWLNIVLRKYSLYATRGKVFYFKILPGVSYNLAFYFDFGEYKKFLIVFTSSVISLESSPQTLKHMAALSLLSTLSSLKSLKKCTWIQKKWKGQLSTTCTHHVPNNIVLISIIYGSPIAGSTTYSPINTQTLWTYSILIALRKSQFWPSFKPDDSQLSLHLMQRTHIWMCSH